MNGQCKKASSWYRVRSYSRQRHPPVRERIAPNFFFLITPHTPSVLRSTHKLLFCPIYHIRIDTGETLRKGAHSRRPSPIVGERLGVHCPF